MKLTEVADEYISKQDAIHTIMGQPPDAHYPSWYAAQIEDIHAADVVPVVRGEWERHMSFGICDKCRYEYDWKATDARNFCPNCGAKME